MAALNPKQDPGFPIDRPIVLVGMMGAGKTTVGRRLAKALGLAFRDADAEIEKAAGMSVSELFEKHGEASFRQGEAKVIARLLAGAPIVLATGGGALTNAATRALIRDKGVSIWLRADVDTLVRRATRRPTRPLLKNGDPR
ncbi:MAG TPA: shikimate kinase, partial [Parvularcula sp.]|nr:shikimate kinase [Parvularcula sp.]